MEPAGAERHRREALRASARERTSQTPYNCRAAVSAAIPLNSICLSVAVASAQVICPSTAGSEIAMIVFFKEVLAHANAR